MRAVKRSDINHRSHFVDPFRPIECGNATYSPYEGRNRRKPDVPPKSKEPPEFECTSPRLIATISDVLPY